MAQQALSDPPSTNSSRGQNSAPAGHGPNALIDSQSELPVVAPRGRKIEPIPQDATEMFVARFLRSFQALQAATRLYHKDHPLACSALESAEFHLRAALGRVTPVAVGLENGALVYCPAKNAEPVPLESKEAWSNIAKNWARCGITSLQFFPQTNLGELAELGLLMNAAGPRSAGEWPARLAEQRIFGIRVNLPLRQRVGAILATLVSALLVHGGADREAPRSTAPPAPATFEDLTAALRLLARFESIVSRAAQSNAQHAAETIHMALSDAENRTIHQLVRTMSSHAPHENEAGDKYLARIAESLLIETLAAQFLARRLPAAELQGVFDTLHDALVRSMNVTAPKTEQPDGEPPLSAALVRAARALLPNLSRHDNGAAEACIERLHEAFWNELPARERSAVLRGPDAWCMPAPVLRRYIEQLLNASRGSHGDGPVRESRILLGNYARALEAEEGRARRTAANGLIDLLPLIAQLWETESPVELDRTAVRALLAEVSPGIAGVLTALIENLARLAAGCGDFREFEHILMTLEQTPRDDEHSHLIALAERLMADSNWRLLMERALATQSFKAPGSARPSDSFEVNDAAMARLLARNPERLLAGLGAMLAAPEGFNALGAMAQLVSATGEPVFGALETHLNDPRRQRAATAIKLLSITEPRRLVVRLPRVLPAWDWNLQDLAIAELTRFDASARPAGVARAFAQILPEAHPLVVPVMLDEIGLAGEVSAIPLLCDVAAGSVSTLRDIFIRIKAVEALGRMHAIAASGVLRTLLRERQGLVYTEPAALRTAAKEALALIENHPSSARLRATEDALAKANISFRRPRRYFRILLDRPYNARIECHAEARSRARLEPRKRRAGGAVAARVSSISLGGAFIEPSHGLAIGDHIRLDIRTGLRHIRSTAVIRNIRGSGGGVEFLHMPGESRERLRRLVQRLLT
jgi:hypothetical protein